MSHPRRGGWVLPSALALLALVSVIHGLDPAYGATFVVNVPQDGNDGACETFNPLDPGTDCTLREAIIAANSTPALDTISFGGLFAGGSVLTISPTSDLPSLIFPAVLDGTTSGAERVNLDGSGAGALATGLSLVGGSTVRGFAIYNFVAGIEVLGPNNLIEGNYVGIDSDQNAAGNDFGVYINDTNNNTIGGTSAPKRNVISGNFVGVQINFPGSTANEVIGNYIGTNVSGTGAIPNNFGVGIGYEASGNTIGGDDVSRRNVISGNSGPGVNVINDATDNSIEGNFIGTNLFGTLAIPNNHGVVLNAPGNTVGGFASPVGSPPANIISGNTESGVLLDQDATASVVHGNVIGLDRFAELPLANGDGVVLESNHGSLIGGVLFGTRNIISGNDGAGVLSRADSYENFVKGNRIGTNGDGTLAIGNAWGVLMEGGTANTLIGGLTSAERNVISGNSTGISITEGSTGNTVQGNRIGSDSTGTAEIANGDGVVISGASENVMGGYEGTTPGGPCSGACNLISGNGSSGASSAVRITGPDAYFNEVRGNYIGTNSDGTEALPNHGTGILVGIAGGTTIGGLLAGSGNVVSGTSGDGIIINTAESTVVLGNLIGTNAAGNAPIPNAGVGVTVIGGDGASIGGTFPGDGNVIAYHASKPGVLIAGANGVSVLGNSIHSNNGGIQLDGGANNDPEAPSLASAVNGSTHITGMLDSTPSTTFRIEFFANAECDASGFGEGQTYLGFVNLVSGGAGHVDVDVTLPATAAAGEVITATATDENGNTSEFSNCVAVTGSATPTPTPPPTSSATPTVTPTPNATPAGQTPTATPTGGAPTSTATATPTGTPGGLQGDTNCDDDVTSVDSLFLLREVAGMGAATCAANGDVNCDGDRTSVDALGVLRYVAGLPVNQNEPCPDIGTPT